MDSYNVPEWKIVEDKTFPKLCKQFSKETYETLRSKDPIVESEVRVLIVGAEANYSYIFLLHSIAAGHMLNDKNMTIVCYVESQHLSMMQEMADELKDCLLPLLTDIIVTSVEEEAFKNINIAILLVQHYPDLSINNILQHSNTFKIFKDLARYFTKAASNVKVLVASEPTLMNAQIFSRFTSTIPSTNITCLSLPLINIVKFQLATKMNAQPDKIKNIIVWGKDTTELTYDLSQASFKDGGKWKDLQRVLANGHWIKNNLPVLVNQRMASCSKEIEVNILSLSKAICEHVNQWVFGLPDPDKDITRMGVESDGSFGLTKGLFVDLPVRINAHGQIRIASDTEVAPSHQILIQSMKEKLLKDVQIVQSLPAFQQSRLI